MDHQVHPARRDLSDAANTAGRLVPGHLVADALVDPGADHSGDCPAVRSATVRDFLSEADHDFHLAMHEALGPSVVQAAPNALLELRKPQPQGALQKAP